MSILEERPCSGPLMLGIPHDLAKELRRAPGVRCDDDQPCLVPVGMLPWWSKEFFGSDRRFDDVYLVAPEAVPMSPSAAIAAGACGTWVVEAIDRDVEMVDRAVRRLAHAACMTVAEDPLLGTEDAVEEHYGIAVKQRSRAAGEHLTVEASWAHIVSHGAVVDSEAHKEIARYTANGPIELGDIWNLYRNVMSHLSRYHPIEGVLPRQQFESIAASPDSAILTRSLDGIPISMAIISTEASSFDWLDPRWVDEIRVRNDTEQVLVIPGIVTSAHARKLNVVDALLDMVLEIVLASGTDTTILFPCNNLSRGYTPRISQRTMDRYRAHLTGDVELLARYVFRGYRVSP